MGRKTLLNWFAMGARNLLREVLPVNKVTEWFIHSHRQESSTIADKNADEGERRKAILKRGGAGFLGGIIIRHLFKWETQKKREYPRFVCVYRLPPWYPHFVYVYHPLRRYPLFVYAYHPRRNRPLKNSSSSFPLARRNRPRNRLRNHQRNR
jgi:hypothetical protein